MSGKMALMVLAIWGILNNEPQCRRRRWRYLICEVYVPRSAWPGIAVDLQKEMPERSPAWQNSDLSTQPIRHPG